MVDGDRVGDTACRVALPRISEPVNVGVNERLVVASSETDTDDVDDGVGLGVAVTVVLSDGVCVSEPERACPVGDADSDGVESDDGDSEEEPETLSSDSVWFGDAVRLAGDVEEIECDAVTSDESLLVGVGEGGGVNVWLGSPETDCVALFLECEWDDENVPVSDMINVLVFVSTRVNDALSSLVNVPNVPVVEFEAV